jgi:NAD(P)-dependent dehydrogenase (short-subunit alcohol dehydrogenase family)
MAERIPVKRIGTAADTANTVYFLASEGAEFITGEAINVSGGGEMH